MTVDETMRDALFQRRSIRSFKDKQVPTELVHRVVEAGQNAPTGGGTQIYSFIWVTDPDLKKTIADTVGQQQFMKEAPVWIMLCIDWQRQFKLFNTLGFTVELGGLTKLWRGMMDVMLAAENMVVAAEALGLGSCYNGGIRMHMEKLAEVLELPENVLPVLMLCIGYPDEEPAMRPRWPLEAVLHENRYSLPSEEALRAYYESANQRLEEMGYFAPGVESWEQHWRVRFNEKANQRLEQRLQEQLRAMGFL